MHRQINEQGNNPLDSQRKLYIAQMLYAFFLYIKQWNPNLTEKCQGKRDSLCRFYQMSSAKHHRKKRLLENVNHDDYLRNF